MSKHEQPNLLEEVRALREEIRQVAGFILELKRDYSVLEDKIELNSSDVLRLLGISKTTLSLAGVRLM